MTIIETVQFADQQLAELIAQYNSSGVPPAAEIGPAGLRAATAERLATRPHGPDQHQVIDVEVPPLGIRARLYRPAASATGLLLYLHGGGWVIGNVETHDRACRRLATTSGVCVLSLDYRLAPEHPFPAAVDDAVAALRWIATKPDVLGDVRTVGIGGDSAGGTTATLACIRIRDEAPEALPAIQVLLYANTDLTGSGASMHDKGHGFALEADDIAWYNRQWVPDETMLGDARVSPLHATNLAGLPAAFVVTCEHDPLRDQGDAYAARLAGAGVPVGLRREPGMVHNFMLWDLASPACAAAADRVAADVADSLA